MINVKRHPRNPVLTPDEEKSWEARSVFNGCPIKEKDKFHFLYRAVSLPQHYFEMDIELSSIGYAVSNDGVHFENRKPFITPEYKWEEFGCEDPRVTKLNDKYFIFYTALSGYPPSPPDIKIGLAITKDFKKIEEKHQVTHFNSKAMALFPEKIKEKIVSVLTVNTDQPPAKIALAFFDEERQIWSEEYWNNWLSFLDNHTLPLQRKANDHIEVGAPPLKTKDGWLLIYCYIQNYLSPTPTFGIEGVLLDLKDPLKIVGRTTKPLLVPKEEYELYGRVPKVIFPSGAFIQDGELYLYYGAADTTCCLAKVKVKDLVKEMTLKKQVSFSVTKSRGIRLEKYQGNPIIQPKPEHNWESKQTFNTAAIYEGGEVYLVYRAMGEEETSVLGCASSKDGYRIDERLSEPIYIPRENFEKKVRPGHSGCEDPRITKIGNKFYMCYTAFDGENPTQVALTSIKVTDFVKRQWNWARPIPISYPSRSDKNSCVMPEKIKGKYVLFHRIGGCIWVDFVDDLSFSSGHYLGGKIVLCPRLDKWDSEKIGIGSPPIKTSAGWLLIYHGLSRHDNQYRLGALLLDLKNPDKITSRLDDPILEPEKEYEHLDHRPGTVFSCGAVVIEGRLFVYYGAADRVVCVASGNLNEILKAIK